MRFAAFSALTLATAAGVLVRALALREFQWFPALVLVSKSGGSVLALLGALLTIGVAAGRGLVWAVFGGLRAVEVEHLYERSWFAVTETCLAMTVFRDEFGAQFVLFFGVLLGAKVLHWIAGDRVDFMEQGPPPTIRYHLKMLPTFLLLLAFDIYMLWTAVDRTLKRGPSAVIVFGFEYTILAAQMAATLVKYALHTIDLRDDQPWEDKSMLIFYLDLVVDFCKLVAYFVFFALVVHFYGLPLHIVRDLYFTLRSFIQRIRDLMRYRRATANMDTRYPDATAEELTASDGTCIICREEMVAGGTQGAPGQRSDRPKKLPCGHMFHFHCLRSWLERQQSCPTCRRSVLVETPQPAPAAPAGAPAAQPGAAHAGQQPGPFPFVPPAAFNGFFGAPAAAAPPPHTPAQAHHPPPHPHQPPVHQLPPAPFPFAWPWMPPPVPIPADRLPPDFVPPPGHGAVPIPGMPVLHPGELPGGAVPHHAGHPAGPSGSSTRQRTSLLFSELDLNSLSDSQLVQLDSRARESIRTRLRELQSIEDQLYGLITRMTVLASAEEAIAGDIGGTSEGEGSRAGPSGQGEERR